MAKDEEKAKRLLLDETPARAFAFLKAIGLSPEIRELVTGYDDAADEDGWRLLRAACRKRNTDEDSHQREKTKATFAAIEAFLERAVAVAHATLSLPYPRHAKTLVGDLLGAKSQGYKRVAMARMFLDRLNTLEADPANAPMFEALAARGITKQERADAADRIDWMIRRGRDDEADKRADRQQKAWDAELEAARTALRTWFLDWSRVAHLYVKRRDLLIRLGLGERKKPARAKKVPA